jgi:hypothetical protein
MMGISNHIRAEGSHVWVDNVRYRVVLKRGERQVQPQDPQAVAKQMAKILTSVGAGIRPEELRVSKQGIQVGPQIVPADSKYHRRFQFLEDQVNLPDPFQRTKEKLGRWDTVARQCDKIFKYFGKNHFENVTQQANNDASFQTVPANFPLTALRREGDGMRAGKVFPTTYRVLEKEKANRLLNCYQKDGIVRSAVIDTPEKFNDFALASYTTTERVVSLSLTGTFLNRN